MIGVVLAAVLAAQCNGPACPSPCTACAFPPVDGANLPVAQLRQIFSDIARRQGSSDLPAMGELERGANRLREPAELPCRLLPAVGATESSIVQFCEASGLTVISFDCGFGIMQVTSGAGSYPGLEARADINVAAGASILAGKWNDDGNFGGSFGDSDPSLVESWYFATWAYNGFVYRNNPNNPDFPSSRPPFHGPASLSRGSYPYQELVWGYLRHPLVKDGEEMWEPLEVSYPDPATIPNQGGLFSVNPPLPAPAHADPCVEVCPEQGCPPVHERTLFLDDLDASFTVTGAVEQHADGGFRDRFLSAPVAPLGGATVTARFEGVAPATGLFDVGGFIPLDPATSTDVRVSVRASGLTTTLSLDQGQSGGFFATIGQVVLTEGERVVVEVTNESSDADASHRVGFDAFRFSWRADAEVPAAAEGEGEGEGEGDGTLGGEGEGDGPAPWVSVYGGCACASSGPSTDVVALGVLALGVRRQRSRGERPAPPGSRGCPPWPSRAVRSASSARP